METLWIFYSLSWLLALGLSDFIKKLVINKWLNKEVFLFMWFAFFTAILAVNFLINSDSIITKHEIRSGFIIGFFDFLAPLWIITALKYLDASFSFVSIRLISSILIFIIWTQILWDNLSFLNISGFVFWIFAIYLLSGYKISQKLGLNKKWFLAIIIAIIGSVWGHSYLKYTIDDVNVDNLMFLRIGVGFLFLTLYIILRRKNIHFTKKQLKIATPYVLVNSILFSFYFLYFLPNIYLLWPLSLWYKILSYSLIVPIILSIIIYNEKVTKRQLIAFVLTLLSLALFII